MCTDISQGRVEYLFYYIHRLSLFHNCAPYLNTKAYTNGQKCGSNRDINHTFCFHELLRVPKISLFYNTSKIVLQKIH